MPAKIIQFPCHCGHPFALPLDMAAGVVQCPDCGRLNDVPTLSDLDNIAADGTLLIREDTTRPKPGRLAEYDLAFRPARVDDDGNEIDLRPSHQDLARIDSTELPLADAPTPGTKRAKPKYDPVTGELVRELEIAKPTGPDAEDIPTARRTTLGYAARDTRQTTPGSIFLKLMQQPTNLFVMFFIFVFYIIFQVLGVFSAGLLAMFGLPWVAANAPLAFILMAHYVNTVDDTGPQMIDELPRPLRNMSWSDDLWGSFIRMAGALILCFMPAKLALDALPPQYQAAAILPAILGVFFFPAVLLTLVTSGTFHNLRPDRLMGVVRACGGAYLAAVFTWALALPLFWFSLWNVYMFPPALRERFEWLYFLNKSFVGFPLMFIGIVAMHFACWHLGLLYREHQSRFPWILQRHVSTRRLTEAQAAAEVRRTRSAARYTDNPNASPRRRP